MAAFFFAVVSIAFAQTSAVTSPGQPIPGTQAANTYSSSVPVKIVPGTIPISLQDAIDRALKQNLALLLSAQDINGARGQRWEQLSALLPQVTADPHVEESKINLNELEISVPGLSLPAAAVLRGWRRRSRRSDLELDEDRRSAAVIRLKSQRAIPAYEDSVQTR